MKNWPDSLQINKYTIRSIVCEASCHPVTQSFGHLIIQSFGHSFTQSLGHLVTWVTRSLGQSVTQSLGHLLTWSLGHLVTRSLGHYVILSFCFNNANWLTNWYTTLGLTGLLRRQLVPPHFQLSTFPINENFQLYYTVWWEGLKDYGANCIMYSLYSVQHFVCMQLEAKHHWFCCYSHVRRHLGCCQCILHHLAFAVMKLCNEWNYG